MSIRSIRPLAIATVLAGLAAVAQPGSVHAAHSYDSCTGFIDSLPATITTQGTWCLRNHLSTSLSAGNAIEIAANNVTVDCNGFRIGGLAAGPSSIASGIAAEERQNAAIRNCQVRGFSRGISITGGAGHVVEDNRLDNNLQYGIHLEDTANSRVKSNDVYDTGGYWNYAPILGTWALSAYGISADADIIGNRVSGLFVEDVGSSNLELVGIRSNAPGGQIRDNAVSGFDMTGVFWARGIQSQGEGTRISGNHVAGDSVNPHTGVSIAVTFDNYCRGNSSFGFNGLVTIFCSEF